MPDLPRILITGTGGPSGISFMRALSGEPLDVYSADIDPYARIRAPCAFATRTSGG